MDPLVDNTVPHPLSCLLEEHSIHDTQHQNQQDVECGSLNRESEEEKEPSETTAAEADDPNARGEASRSQRGTNTAPTITPGTEAIDLTTLSGGKWSMPREVAEYLVGLQKKIRDVDAAWKQSIHRLTESHEQRVQTIERSYEQRIRNLEATCERLSRTVAGQQTLASSTRLDANSEKGPAQQSKKQQTPNRNQTRGRQGHVNFRDTFTCQYAESSSPLDNTRDSTRGRPPPQPFSTQSGAWGRGDTHRSQNTSMSMRDVGQVVRKWGVHFSGEDDQSIDSFLARIEECREMANLSEEEMLPSLSELFTGLAATWYRNEKDSWRSMSDFTAAFRKWYGPSRRIQQRLLSDAHERTQHAQEPVRDFFTRLKAIVRRLEPPLSESQTLDLFHRNMRPELQLQVKRDQFADLDTLLDLAVEAEVALGAKRVFREPPPADHFFLPEAAFKPRESKQRSQPKTKVAAVSQKSEQSEIERLTSALEKMMSRQEELVHVVKSQSKELMEAVKGRSNQSSGSRSSSREDNRPDLGTKPKNAWRADRRDQRRPSPPRRDSRKPPNDPQPAESRPKTQGQVPRGQSKGPLECFGCGEKGYMRSNCPNCSGNARGGR